MMIIPIAAVPSQTLNTVLAGQNCKINLYQKTTGMYCDLTLNNVPIVSAGIVRDRVRIVRQPYLGFVGDIAVCDTQGASDPTYDGLGARYMLVYLEASEL